MSYYNNRQVDSKTKLCKGVAKLCKIHAQMTALIIQRRNI